MTKVDSWKLVHTDTNGEQTEFDVVRIELNFDLLVDGKELYSGYIRAERISKSEQINKHHSTLTTK